MICKEAISVYFTEHDNVVCDNAVTQQAMETKKLIDDDELRGA
jgi:hypothetical protein